MLLVLSFSEVVLSENKRRLLGLAQVTHIFQFTEGGFENGLYLLIGQVVNVLVFVFTMFLILILPSFLVDGSKKFVHFHNIDVPTIVLADF